VDTRVRSELIGKIENVLAPLGFEPHTFQLSASSQYIEYAKPASVF